MAEDKKYEKGKTPDTHPIQAIYHTFALLGIDPHKIKTRFRPDAETNVSVAVPSYKFAICLDNDRPGKLEANGWILARISFDDVQTYSRVFHAIDGVRVGKVLSKSEELIKTTSNPEEWLLEEIIKANLPMPKRSYVFYREDGKELTTPDFTWEEYRIAFFLDGDYWHGVKQDREIIKGIQDSKEVGEHIVDSRRDKQRKDKAIRNELAARGWFVLACSDSDLLEEGGCYRQVQNIRIAMDSAKRLMDQQKTVSGNKDLLEFLG